MRQRIPHKVSCVTDGFRQTDAEAKDTLRLPHQVEIITQCRSSVGPEDHAAWVNYLDEPEPFSTVPVIGLFSGSGVPPLLRSDFDPPTDSFRSGFIV